MQLDPGMSKQPFMHRGRLMGGQVVADHVNGQAGLSLPVDLIEEVAEVDARCWADSLPITLPVAVFSAANRSMVPCRV